MATSGEAGLGPNGFQAQQREAVIQLVTTEMLHDIGLSTARLSMARADTKPGKPHARMRPATVRSLRTQTVSLVSQSEFSMVLPVHWAIAKLIPEENSKRFLQRCFCLLSVK